MSTRSTRSLNSVIFDVRATSGATTDDFVLSDGRLSWTGASDRVLSACRNRGYEEHSLLKELLRQLVQERDTLYADSSAQRA